MIREVLIVFYLFKFLNSVNMNFILAFSRLKWIEYDIDWNSHEYVDADCNWYEAINWEAVKTRKSWIEQLFPYWFIFYDIE